MGAYIDGVIESFKHSLNVPLWLYFMLVTIISLIVTGIVCIVFLLLGIFLASGILGTDILKMILDLVAGNAAGYSALLGLSAALTIPAVIANLAVVFVVFFIAWIIVDLLIGSFFEAALFFLARDSLQGAKLDLGSAFSSAKEKFLVLFKVRVLVGIFVSILSLVIFSPLLASIPALMQQMPLLSMASGNPGTASSAMLAFIGFFLLAAVLFLVLLLVLFFLSPFLTLMVPTAIFSKLGAVDSIRRTIEITKAKYWESLGFLLLFGVLAGIALSVFIAIIIVIEFLSIFAIFFIALAVFLAIVRVALQFAFGTWMNAWTTLSQVILYDLNSGHAKKPARKSFVGGTR